MTNQNNFEITTVITENVFLIATLTAWTEEYSVCLQKGHIVFFLHRF